MQNSELAIKQAEELVLMVNEYCQKEEVKPHVTYVLKTLQKTLEQCFKQVSNASRKKIRKKLKRK